MNVQTIISLPDMIRGSRNPYQGPLGEYVDDRDEQRLANWIARNTYAQLSGEETLNDMLALIPAGCATEALRAMYDDPNAQIID